MPVPYGPVPYGPAPHGPVPYGPAPHGPVPYGPAPYGPVPYGPVVSAGEISLRGQILPVGGVREKVLAAHAAGVCRVLLPHPNLKDLEELPNKVREAMDFVWCETIEQALEEALELPNKGRDEALELPNRGRDEAFELPVDPVDSQPVGTVRSCLPVGTVRSCEPGAPLDTVQGTGPWQVALDTVQGTGPWQVAASRL